MIAATGEVSSTQQSYIARHANRRRKHPPEDTAALCQLPDGFIAMSAFEPCRKTARRHSSAKRKKHRGRSACGGKAKCSAAE